MADATYCPSCGESLQDDDSQFIRDELLNIYRIPFRCRSCGYRGEILRHSTIGERPDRPEQTEVDW